MIEEQARVVALEPPDAVWVETVRRGSCDACNAGQGCGHGLLERLGAGSPARTRVLAQASARVGDEVTIGIPEDLLLRGILRVYLLPLALLFGGALLGSWLGPGDGPAILFALVGLAAGFVYNRGYSRRHENDPEHQPRLLRVNPEAGAPFMYRQSQ